MPVYFPFAAPIAPPTAPRVTDDFNYRSSPATYNIHWVNAGANSYTTIASTSSGQRGLIQYSVAAVGQKGGIRAGSAIGFPTVGLLLFGANVLLGNLSDGTNRYQVQVGVFDNTLNSVNGYGFRYQDNINGAKWQCFGGASTFDSGEGATLTVNKFRIWCFAPNSPVLFMVNDRIVGSILSPLFPGTMWPAITIEKVVGGTARTMTIDYAGIYWTRPDVTLPE